MSQKFRLGELSIRWLQGGEFEIDGGSMFGVVPRVLWEKKCASTPDNHVLLANSPMLLQTGQSNVLIEKGLGNKLTPKQRAIFRVRAEWDLVAGLSRLGLCRDSISHVVLTHGDFDHAGGVTMLNDSGGLARIRRANRFASGRSAAHALQQQPALDHGLRQLSP